MNYIIHEAHFKQQNDVFVFDFNCTLGNLRGGKILFSCVNEFKKL